MQRLLSWTASVTLLVVVSAASASTSATAMPPTAPTSPAAVQTNSGAARAAVIALTLNRVTADPIVTGTKVAFTGTAPRAVEGKQVRLFRKLPGKSQPWVKVASSSTVSNGAFTVTGVAIAPGPNRWRVQFKPKNKELLRSKTVKHAVYRWFNMTDDNAIDYDSWDFEFEQVDIGSATYPQALVLSNNSANGSVAWNASYKCVQFDAYYGLSNDSTTDSVGGFALTIDGADTSYPNQGIGNASHVTIDMTSHMRITLALSAVAGADSYPAWAKPRMLCSSSPF